jgi:hypothetical protein
LEVTDTSRQVILVCEECGERTVLEGPDEGLVLAVAVALDEMAHDSDGGTTESSFGEPPRHLSQRSARRPSGATLIRNSRD